MVFGIANRGERRQRAVLRLVEHEREPFVEQSEDVDVGLRRGPIVAIEEEGVAEDRFRCVVDSESVRTAAAHHVDGEVGNGAEEVLEERNGWKVVEGCMDRRGW